MAEKPGDQSDGGSSHTLSTEPGGLQHLHTPLGNSEQTTSSSTRQNTQIEEGASDVEKGISKGEDLDKPATTAKTEATKEAQNTTAPQNEKEKDHNLIGWEGMGASSPYLTVLVTQLSVRHRSQRPSESPELAQKQEIPRHNPLLNPDFRPHLFK